MLDDKYRQILTVKLQYAGKERVLSALKELQSLEEVLVAEPIYDYMYHEDYVPNDPFYNQEEQWGLYDGYGIYVSEDWDIYNEYKSQETIKVGIFESNLQADHPDLTVGDSFFVGSGSSAHGTHVAGILGAKINNNIGIAGVAPVEIYLLNPSDFVNSLNWAEQNGIKIINASFYFSRPRLDDVGNVIQEAYYNASYAVAIENYDGLFIASAGNQNIDNDLHPQYPAGYEADNIITVGSIGVSGSKSDFSNYGVNTVDIFAPGENIISTYPYDTYAYMSGTSMAAPHVAGVAALLMSIDQSLTVEEIKETILNNDNDLLNLRGLCATGGTLNATSAIEAALSHEMISDLGYEGSTFHWKGKVVLDHDSDITFINDMSVITNEAILNFKVKTVSSSNAFLEMDGEIKFELKTSSGEVLQTNICTVGVDLFNNVTLNGDEFSIDAGQLDIGVYSLVITSHFTRGTWSQDDTESITIAINRPFTIMDGFGYNASWYKWNGRVDVSSDALYMFANDLNGLTLMGDIPVVFTVKSDFAYNAWTQISGSITFTLKDSNGNVVPINGSNSHVANVTVGLVSNVTISNGSFSISGSDLADGSYTLTLNCTMSKGDTTYNTSDTYSFYVQNALCVAEDTLITLADGTQKEVEDLTGNEELLVWNLLTGEFDSAPILFVDSDAPNLYQVIELHFSDGTTVDVIGEHAFWSVEQNEYVFLRNDAAQYIGDSFMKRTINGFGVAEMTEVELVDVIVETEYTTAWSPVTYGHLCYYVNGMLSMPGATEGLINIFEVNPTTMKYDEIAMNNDIATYGLFTYEEFNSLIPIEEEMFDAFNGQYLKVAIGKGLIDMDELEMLVERYEEYLIG